MIHAALAHLAAQLNQFLGGRFALAEDVVVLSSLHELDGSPSPNVANKLVIFLANITRDASAKNLPVSTDGRDWSVRSYPPLHLNLHVIVAACFGGSNYPQSLKLLSAAILFFQKHPVFDHVSSPDLDRRIDKLMLEIESLGIQDLSNLWGVAGGSYLPSVLYRLRMISVDAQDIEALAPTVRQPETKLAR